MSSGITLTAATRQNLLSLQDTASLLSTTQNRLSTGKKVNSALDNPINFFTSSSLNAKSGALSGLLDGISNGIQTIQAANTGITKLQGLTDQLKSVAQQALASSNSFTSKATTVSGALTGATASNLLSTGPTQALSDITLGVGATAVAAANTASTNFATGTPAVTTGNAFTLPANAVAGTYSGTTAFSATAANNSTIKITIGSGAVQTLTLGTNASLSDIQTAIAGNTTLSGAGVSASLVNGKLTISGSNDGQATTVQGSDAAFFGDTTAHTTTGQQAAGTSTLTINGTAVTINGGKVGDTSSTVTTAALAAINAQTATTGVTAAASSGALVLTGKTDGSSFTVQGSDSSLGFSPSSTTIYNKIPSAQTLTINGVPVSIAAGSTEQQAIGLINAQSGLTGVTASDTSGKLTLTGPADGSSFSVQGSTSNTIGFSNSSTTITGTFHPSSTTLATAIGFKTGDTFSVNGQSVGIAAGDTLASIASKVSTVTNGSVTASFDPTARKFNFTAADANTSVTLGNGSTATSLVSNLGYSAGKTTFAAGLGSGTTSPLSGSSLTVSVGNGNTTSFTFGSAAGQISTLTQLNTALASVNAQASIDASTGKISITTANDNGADNLTIVASGNTNPFTSGTSSAIIGGDGATTRNGLIQTYNNLLNQINQLSADSGFNGVNLLAGDTLKMNFNDTGTSNLSVQGTAVNSANLGLSSLGNTDFQENSTVNKVMNAINSASSQLKGQAASLGSNLAVVQNRQDFTKQMINVLDTGAANLTNADLNEEAANSQALSTRNSLGISALSLANQAQQGILQLLR